jgi:hypothetical protein
VGRDLGITVVADGIERAEQRDLLAAMGCTLGLGPFVAAPVPPASLPGLAGGQGPRGGMAAGPGLAGEIAGGRGRAGEMAGGPGLGGERLAGECLAGERGADGDHGAGGEQGPADGELPFGDVITPARDLAS